MACGGTISWVSPQNSPEIVRLNTLELHGRKQKEWFGLIAIGIEQIAGICMRFQLCQSGIREQNTQLMIVFIEVFTH